MEGRWGREGWVETKGRGINDDGKIKLRPLINVDLPATADALAESSPVRSMLAAHLQGTVDTI